MLKRFSAKIILMVDLTILTVIVQVKLNVQISFYLFFFLYYFIIHLVVIINESFIFQDFIFLNISIIYYI